jgi:hypothetical protein
MLGAFSTPDKFKSSPNAGFATAVMSIGPQSSHISHIKPCTGMQPHMSYTRFILTKKLYSNDVV